MLRTVEAMAAGCWLLVLQKQKDIGSRDMEQLSEGISRHLWRIAKTFDFRKTSNLVRG